MAILAPIGRKSVYTWGIMAIPAWLKSRRTKAVMADWASFLHGWLLACTAKITVEPRGVREPEGHSCTIYGTKWVIINVNTPNKDMGFNHED